ncbi:hypothetical protein SNE40_018490 [Patella caerulea]|uniref:RWD domain-containing protein n=1 Tax=Patella caerulea TaxID=87958 RepID=A0AAN8J568_PATCE
MTDYKEEQNNEIEALQSIYSEELEVIETEPYYVFALELSSAAGEEPQDDTITCTLQFTYTPKYPDESPQIEITESENLDFDQTKELNRFMRETAEENLGMVMVFTIVSAVQEKLGNLIEEAKEKILQEKERKLKEEEEIAFKKFQGTRVTIENFLAWKAKFDAEMAELKQKKQSKESSSKKKTGRQLFLEDQSLNESDINFLPSEENAVEVDESLFQDLDDLDLDEELDIDDDDD